MPIWLIQILVGVVLSVAGQLFSSIGKQDQKQKVAGVRGTLQSGGDLAPRFIVGRYGSAGQLRYAGSWGNAGETPNAYYSKVIEVSCLPIRGFTGFFVNGQRVTLAEAKTGTLGYAVLEFRANGVDHLWINPYTGAQTAEDPLMLAQFGADPERPYAGMVGRGTGYFVATALINRELFSGFPEYLAEVDGIVLDDPRGDGQHDNPIVAAYTLLRGVSYDGEWLYGPQGYSDANFRAANLESEADKCDAVRPGSTDKRYRIGLDVALDEEPHAVIGELLKGCAGRWADLGGVYRFLVGAPDEPVVAITDEDIIITEQQTLEPFPGLEDLHNGMAATYPEPGEAWEMKEAPPRYRADLEAADDGRRLVFSTQFKAVPWAVQVQDLMRTTLEDARRFRKHTQTMPPEFWEYEPFDVVAWTSARNGYVGKGFMITVIDDLPNANQFMGWQETEPEDYDWESGFELPYQITPLVIARPAPQHVSGPSVAPVPGELAYDAFWSPASVASDVDFVRVSHRVPGGEDNTYVVPVPKPDLLTGSARVPVSLTLAGAYIEVQLEYIALSGRPMVASAWMPVTIADVRIGPDDLTDEIKELIEETFPADIQALKDDVQEVRDTADAERDARLLDTTVLAGEDRDLRSAITRAMAQVGEISLIHEERRQKSVTELRTDFSGSLATVRQEFETAVGPTGALALADIELRALVAGEKTTREAAINDVQQALVEGDQASATAVQTLATQMRGGYGGNDADLVTEGLLASLRQIIDSGDSVLAQAIEGLSVGLGIEFDYRHIWDFADDAEGWTGTGAPTATGGRLRPADGAAPYVVSPVLELDGDRYRRFKALIYRTGAPVWAGYLWWKGPSDTTWDAARRVAIPEPAFAPDGSATLEVATTWSGTIAQVRVDATSSADAGNFIAYEWLALGRRFPPPSTAYVDAIRQALVTADSAEAAARLTLKAALMGSADPETADLADLTEGLFHEAQTAWVAADQVVSDAVAVLASRMTDAEGELDAVAQVQSTQQTAINAIDGALTILASDYDDIVIQLEGKASVETTNGLSTQIANLGAGGLDVLGSYVRTLGSTVQGLASNVNGLGLFIQDNRERTDKAVAEATRYTNTQITQTNDQLTVVAEDVNALLTQLLGVEGTVLAQANTLIAHDAQLVQLGDDIEAVSSSVINVEAAVGDISGNGLFAMRVAATPSGFTGAIELGIRGVAGGTPSWTGLILARKADGTSQLFFRATQTAIFDGNGAQQALFDAAGAYFNNARIRGLKVENMDAGFIEAIEVDADTILAQNASVTGQLTVGSAILIDGPNGRIVVSD